MSRNLEITLRQIEYVCVRMSSSRKICTHFTLIDVVHAIVKEQKIVFAIIQSRRIRNACTLVKKLRFYGPIGPVVIFGDDF